jgi:hypothetical protein
MAQDFLSPAVQVKALREKGESAMKASLAKRLGSGDGVRLGAPPGDKPVAAPRGADRGGTNGGRCSRVLFDAQAW